MNQVLPSEVSLPVDELGDLMVDLWRIQKRASRETSTPATVLTACEMALERAAGLGFDIRDMVGNPYDDNQRAQVVHRDGETNLIVIDCLSPAVYFNDQLIKRAEVVLKGDERIEESNS